MRAVKAASGIRILPLVTVGLLCYICGLFTGRLFDDKPRTQAPSSAESYTDKIWKTLGSGQTWAARDLAASPSTNPALPSSTPINTPAVKPAPKKTATTPYYSKGTTRYRKSYKAEPVCLNTCQKAKNGVCDEGRFAPKEPVSDRELDVFCDLGTDCDDCGPWTPSGHAPWITDNTTGPIARLLRDEIKVHSRQAGLKLGFQFAYTDPKKDAHMYSGSTRQRQTTSDHRTRLELTGNKRVRSADSEVDVSGHMRSNGVVEAAITSIFFQIFQEKCDPAKNGGKRGLFVDVGANFGWFSVLAASQGCRVIGFEPVPHFHAFYEYSVHVNGLAKLVDMRGNVVSHVTDTTLMMVVPNKGIWGTAGIEGLNVDKAIKESVNREIHVPAQRLDDLIHEDVLLMKVDVEGWEWSVMQGAAQLLTTRHVENIIMEYSPGVPERNYRYKEVKATVSMLVNFVDLGYRIAHIGEATKHAGGWPGSPLGTYQEVTGHNLMYDLVDAELFTRQQLGCPVPERLKKYKAWHACQANPEDPSPRSFRSMIGHNTNLWAVKQSPRTSKLCKLKGTVGMMPLDAPQTQFFVRQEQQDATLYQGLLAGQGSRFCAHIPAEYQVRHRCPCMTSTVCDQESKDAELASNNYEIASSYILTAEEGKLVNGTGKVAEVLRELGSARYILEPYKPGVIKGMLVDTVKTTTQ